MTFELPKNMIQNQKNLAVVAHSWTSILRAPFYVFTSVMNLQLIFLALCVSFASCESTEKAAHPDDKIIEPEDGFKGVTTPTPLVFTEKWVDWETWEAPEKIIKMTPYYKSGYDYDGLPVIACQYGMWNYRELAHLKHDEIDDFLRRHEQSVRRVQAGGAANNNSGVVLIYDWDGFSMGNYASGKALKLALRVFTAMTRLNDSIRYGFLINTNFAAETFLNSARPFLGNILEKFEIYGGRREKWRQGLLRKIPSSQLPPEYGGDKDWKPVPWNK